MKTLRKFGSEVFLRVFDISFPSIKNGIRSFVGDINGDLR